jgi:hypothetical protein
MHKYPTDVLTPEESAALRELMIVRGVDAATKLVGLRDRDALVKAAFGERVSRLTASVVRSALANGASNAST